MRAPMGRGMLMDTRSIGAPGRVFRKRTVQTMLVGLFLGLAAGAVVADPADQECVANKAKLNSINKQIADLGGTTVPGQQLTKDMTAVISQLIADLKELKGDTEKVIGPMQNAQKKLDEIAKAMGEQKIPIPPGWKGLRDSLDGLAKGIRSGVKRSKDSPVGKAVADVGKGADLMGSAIGKLEQVKSGLDTLASYESAYDKAANGTGAEQIEALKFGFDQLKGKLGAGDVPGLGQFLDAYSTALDGMAKGVGSIEQSMKKNIKQAEEALKHSGTDVDFDKLYPGLKSPREKLAGTLQALKDAKAALEKERTDADCDKPAPPPDPCKGDPTGLKDLANSMSSRQNTAYEDSQKNYEARFGRLAELSWSEPRDTPSTAELQLSSAGSQIAALRRALAANDASAFGSPGRAGAAANDLAKRLGVAEQRGITSLRDIAPLLDRMEPALAKRKDAARKEAKAAYEKAHADWQKEYNQARAAAKEGMKSRDAARDAYKKAVGDALEKETAAKQWSKEKCDLFDQCFPWLAKLKKSCGPPPAATKAPAAPAKAPATATNSPAEPPKCQRGGGLAGAINNVADQIAGCK